jgi:hypothetical protein
LDEAERMFVATELAPLANFLGVSLLEFLTKGGLKCFDWGAREAAVMELGEKVRSMLQELEERQSLGQVNGVLLPGMRTKAQAQQALEQTKRVLCQAMSVDGVANDRELKMVMGINKE